MTQLKHFLRLATTFSVVSHTYSFLANSVRVFHPPPHHPKQKLHQQKQLQQRTSWISPEETNTRVGTTSISASTRSSSSPTSINSSNNNNQEKQTSLQTSVNELKKILFREYTTFFNPMYTEYYNKDVTFTDPMTSLSGVQSYQNNVDMLASRTFMGKVLFSDAGITLHSVSGGKVVKNTDADGDGDNLRIEDITTRWTLRLTAKILPWKPTARFSGISIYKVIPNPSTNSKVGVSIINQIDYWDSINIQPNSNGKYQTVDKGIAINDFLNQLKPGGFQAQSAAPELPYQLLRRGDGYEIRKYPSYAGVKLPYKRRDEGFGSLGAFAKGMNPLSPALMDVQKDDISDKYMMWPLTYTQPGEENENGEVEAPKEAIEKAGQGQWRTIKVVNVTSKIVAIREFSDASMEPVVRNADRELRELLKKDGLKPMDGSEDLVQFAQYDAIFSMGRRRGEVWIDLADDGHPWR